MVMGRVALPCHPIKPPSPSKAGDIVYASLHVLVLTGLQDGIRAAV